MLISCLCITYGRPQLLEEALESFLRQDYKNKELIIINDLAEQTLIFEHPQVKIFNFKERFVSIGEKRNKSVELSSGEILTSWDDDDISLPWRLSQIAKAFENNPNLGYFKPKKAWCIYENQFLRPHENGFWTQVAYTKKTFDEIKGYKNTSVGEDTDLCHRLICHLNKNRKVFLEKEFPEEEYAFIYGWDETFYHLSDFAEQYNENTLYKIEQYIKQNVVEHEVKLNPHWKQDYLKITREILVTS